MKRTALTLALCALMASGPLWAEFETKKAPVMTKWAKDVDINNPHPEYPRPQMERTEWMNLNGVWEYKKGAEGDKAPFGEELEGRILVPFAVESALSGVMEHMDRLWYRRTFEVPADWNGRRVMLNFGAVDYESEVFVNGKSMGVHKGGYLPFSYDITDALKKGANELVVRVFDPTEKGGQPRGKQTTSPGGIMYTPTTGIWQTVWLEPVAASHIEDIKIVPDVDKGQVEITVFSKDKDARVNLEIFFEHEGEGGPLLYKHSGKANTPAVIRLQKPVLWSPENPHLYGIKATLYAGSDGAGKASDSVKSYFGMRKISVGEVGGDLRIMLNNKPVFMNGPLDQGYWPDGILTAPTDEALRSDIDRIKEYGFNFARKHIKVEPARWYYWADKLGLMVWQDAPSCNSYISQKERPEIDRQAFEEGLVGMVDFLKNSPAVVTWVIFNESQGQFDTERLAGLVEKLDPTRLVNEASGDKWFGKGHIRDVHHYPAPITPQPNGKQVLACGEFGGIGMPVPGHVWFERKDNWGYTNVNSPADLLFKYADFYDKIRNMRDQKGLAAVVYTQITDVMTEVNGLLTYDRIPKLPAEKLRKVNEFNFKMPDFEAVMPTSEKEPQKWMYSTEHVGAWQLPKTENDSAFKEGTAPFGEASGVKGNTEWKTPDIWLRRTFKVGGLTQSEIDRLMLRLMHDENYIVFINGVEASQKGGYITGYEYYPIRKEALDTIKPNSENTIAVFCHNTVGGQFIDVGLYVRDEIDFAD